jgi:hypothetical protein
MEKVKATRCGWHAWSAVLLLAGCASRVFAPVSVIDPDTGVSLTVVDQPLVLARDRRDIAVHARDYLTLIAAEVNESGRRSLVWVAHQWSTIDPRTRELRADPPGGPLLVLADGRELRLHPIGDTAAGRYQHNRALAPPEDVRAVTTVFQVDADTLAYVAGSSRLSAMFPDSALAMSFGIWNDGRPALSRFVEAVSD